MKLLSFIELVFLGKDHIARHSRREQEISDAKRDVDRKSEAFSAAHRQFSQTAQSGTRVLTNMTEAMILMETRRGRE